MPDFQDLQITNTLHETSLLSDKDVCKVSLRSCNTSYYLIYP